MTPYTPSVESVWPPAATPATEREEQTRRAAAQTIQNPTSDGIAGRSAMKALVTISHSFPSRTSCGDAASDVIESVPSRFAPVSAAAAPVAADAVTAARLTRMSRVCPRARLPGRFLPHPLRGGEVASDPPRQLRERERNDDSERRPAGDHQREEVVRVRRLRPDLLVERVDDRRGRERHEDHPPPWLAPF